MASDIISSTYSQSTHRYMTLHYADCLYSHYITLQLEMESGISAVDHLIDGSRTLGRRSIRLVAAI